ncbi:MAG TPA: hypothetical protein VFY05_04930, partial [Candidatus Angelobacter sp.]|nr:hypothetical protein [Candidatus Angelobacter sp.]
IDEKNLYGRLDFSGKVPDALFDLVINLESWPEEAQRPRKSLRLDVNVEARKIQRWSLSSPGLSSPADEDLVASSEKPAAQVAVVLARSFEFKVPLAALLASPLSGGNGSGRIAEPVAKKARVRFSLWQNRLPVDALPLEGWIELLLVPEEELIAM